MIGSATIVGAGIGGLCTAVGLHRAGWSVTVVERWPEVVGIGAGLGIWPDAQRALDELGVGEAFRQRAVPFGAISLFSSDGQRLCAVPSAGVEHRAGQPIRILRRVDLIQILLAAASGCHILTDVDIASNPELIASADIVVGADGLRSTVRRMCFPDESAAPRSTDMVAFRGAVPFELYAADYGETWGDGAIFGVTRLAPGTTNWFAAVPADVGTYPQMITRFGAWRSPIPAVLAATDPDTVLRHPIEDLDPRLTTYVTSRAVLIGDAAHAMTPNLGRGACEAIVDAAELVSCLGRADDVGTALSRFDRVRRRPTQRVVERSRRAMTLATTRHASVRNHALRLAAPFIR